MWFGFTEDMFYNPLVIDGIDPTVPFCISLEALFRNYLAEKHVEAMAAGFLATIEAFMHNGMESLF